MTHNIRRILVTGGSGFIGTNYIEYLRENVDEIEFINIDVRPPQISSHNLYWEECDLQNAEQVEQIFLNFQPTDVVHLAAKTDTDSDDIDDYSANITGTENIITAIQGQSTIQRVIITSTQFVKRPGTMPDHDLDFDPHTAYGQSKVRNEEDVRNANLNCIWTIIRPTNIWGPWHPRYPYEFWRVLSNGLYFHPSGKSAVRSYGYITNVIYQIEKILRSEKPIVHGKVFYVGDESIKLIDWVNGFSLALNNRKVTILPRRLIQVMGWIGDAFKLLGIRFPLTSSRFKSMTTDDVVPMNATIDAFGVPPTTLSEGIRESTDWMIDAGFVQRPNKPKP